MKVLIFASIVTALATVDSVESKQGARAEASVDSSTAAPARKASSDRAPASASIARNIVGRFDELISELERDSVRERSELESARLHAEQEREQAKQAAQHEYALRVTGLVKHFGDTVAVDGIDLDVEAGSLFGIVGPNGAGKTTTLSMITGLLRPDAGTVIVRDADVWRDPAAAKRNMGVLPDRLRMFDRLTGSQLLYYSGVLRGLDPATVRERAGQLAATFGLEASLNRLVTNYSAGMTKKLALAAALIHAPRLLVLDEPFESVDPVSAQNVTAVLREFADAGGTVVLSSHSMDLIQRVCDGVAVIVNGKVLASGTVDDVRGKGSLEDRFVELAGGRTSAEGLEWLHSFSD